jgi:peptidoglycan/xylan/chitin deacetylase (PgdA/CDA1 family)
MMRAGRVLRRAGVATLATGLNPSDNLRVTLTHHVPPNDLENFARLVDQLCSERTVVDAGQVVRSYADQSGPATEGKGLAFTFDDGLLSSFHAAQSILNPRGIKAIFFIPTMILDLTSPEQMRDFFRQNVYRQPSSELPPDKYMTMSADQLFDLHDQGHMVLPHTHSHASLRSLTTPADIDRELRMPKLLLEDMLQSQLDGFAFPIGTERVVSGIAYEAVRRIYSVCFTGLGGVNTATTDCHTLYRDCVHPFHPPGHVANVTAGSYDLFYKGKMWRLKRAARLPTG